MRSKTAADIMTPDPVSVSTDCILTDAIRILLDNKISFLPVVDEGRRLIGVITEYDILNFALSGEAGNTTVNEAMTRTIMCLEHDDDFETVANTCVAKRLHRAPVTKDGVLVGIISRRDLLRELLNHYRTKSE